jgi:hypothetical protein
MYCKYCNYLRKLNELEFRKQYQIEISNRFASFEKVRTEIGVGRTLKEILKPQLTTVLLCMNRSSINHYLI